MMPNEYKSKKEELLALIRKAIEQDEQLRGTYQVKDKFRFIRDRLKSLLTRVEESVASLTQQEKEKKVEPLAEDETLIFVYLFNAQGILLQSWLKMLQPSVFYEYSINRPIYVDRKAVEAVIKTKGNKQQHGFLIFAQKKGNILGEALKDALGQETIKIKDGSLRAERLMGFVHNEIEYRIEDGSLVKTKG